MDSGEKKIGANDPYYEDRKKISLDAHVSGCLIHSVLTHRLYTPKEFLDSGEKVTYTLLGAKEYASITRFYPGFLLESRVKEVQRARVELSKAEANLHEAIQKIIVTFDFIAKPKKK